MAAEKMKCPMCGTRLKNINGRMTCKDCGYYVREQNGSQTWQSQQTASSASGASSGGYRSPNGNQASGGYQTSGRSQAPGGYQASGQSPKSKGRGGKIAITCISVCAVIIAGIVANLALTDLRDLFDRLISPDSPAQSHRSEEQPASTQYYNDSPENESQNQTKPVEKARLPRSSFFQELASVIFGKDYSSVTPEEYDTITALEINKEERFIYYLLKDQEEYQSLTFSNAVGMELSDLACFTGLESIWLDDDLTWGDLDGLEHLQWIYAENNLSDFLKIIPNPENILSLRITDSIFEHSLDGIEAFTNLQYLTVEYDSLDDISALESLPLLEGLSLLGCDDLTDYSPLLSLGWLRSLSLQSSQLKSIDFINSMPDLTSLYVEDSQISNVNALANCPGLTALSLIDNTLLEDYSPVGELDQLTTLALHMNSNSTLPSFQKLTALKELSVKHAGDLSPLRDAVNVTTLQLEECAGWELEALTSMQEITALYIKDFSSYVDSLEPLTRLSRLDTLDLGGTSVFGNVEEIFGIPTLRRLSLDNCQVGMDFDKIPVNTTLEELSMNDISILRDPTYNNGDKIYLSEHYDLFASFPSLVVLQLRSDRIDSLDFVENLPLLQYLEITDNSVTSLKPLEALPNFQMVWCGKNTILEGVSENSQIQVSTEE